jgi:glycosyltransferase involved in cell wall biosynthesis
LDGAAVVIVIGADMHRVIESKLSNPSIPLETIRNWFDERRVRPRRDAANEFAERSGVQGKIVVQYSGNMGRTHNLEPVIAAAIELRNEPAVVFQFVGDGTGRPALAQMAQEANLRNVQFLPFEPIESLSKMLSTAHLAIVALSSEFTGLSVPSKAYGAMANGVPILGLLESKSEIGELIQRSGCGVVVHPATGSAIARVVRQLLSDPARFRRMGNAGQRAFLSSYTLTRAVCEYDRVLRSVLGTDAYAPDLAGAKPRIPLTAEQRDSTLLEL